MDPTNSDGNSREQLILNQIKFEYFISRSRSATERNKIKYKFYHKDSETPELDERYKYQT